MEQESIYKYNIPQCPDCGLDFLDFCEKFVEEILLKFDFCPKCNTSVGVKLVEPADLAFEVDIGDIDLDKIANKQVLPTVFLDQVGGDFISQDSSTQFLNVYDILVEVEGGVNRDAKTEFLEIADMKLEVCVVCQMSFPVDSMKEFFQNKYCSNHFPEK